MYARLNKESRAKHVRLLNLPGLEGGDNIQIGCQLACNPGCVFRCC